MNTQSLTLDQLKNRLIERIKHVTGQLDHTDIVTEPRLYSTRKGELVTAKRRLRLLEEKIVNGTGSRK